MKRADLIDGILVARGLGRIAVRHNPALRTKREEMLAQLAEHDKNRREMLAKWPALEHVLAEARKQPRRLP